MVEGVRRLRMDKVTLTSWETDYPSQMVENPGARNPVKPETRRSNRPRGGDGLVRSESVHAQSGWGRNWPRPDRQCGQHGKPSGGRGPDPRGISGGSTFGDRSAALITDGAHLPMDPENAGERRPGGGGRVSLQGPAARKQRGSAHQN